MRRHGCLIAMGGAAAWGQPLMVWSPQRVVGASGSCCTSTQMANFTAGPWMNAVTAPCAGGSAHAEQNTQVGGALIAGSGFASAASGGLGCDAQATSSMLIPFDLSSPLNVRVSVALQGAGTLRAQVTLKVLPLLSTVREWNSPANVDEFLTLPPGSYRLSVSAGGGTTASSGSASFGLSFGPGCYANCDNSTVPPVLNAMDFTCFMNRFAAGDSRANCDGSTPVPVLNVEDFICFLNAFGRGCTL